MKVTKVFTERNDGYETRTLVTVNYHPKNHAIDLVSITVERQGFMIYGNTLTYSPFWTSIDVTEVMIESGLISLEKIQAIDWEQEYRLTKEAA